MRTSKFKKDERLAILAKLDTGSSVNELSREYQVSVATLHKWKRKRQ
ncbi:MAG: transposase [Anaerolineae bacterium]|nr:transposase [Anaerolineae bacterium]